MRSLAVTLILALSAMGITLPAARENAQVDYAWDMMCLGNLRPITKKFKGYGRKEGTELKDAIEPCTKHIYQFSGKPGQQMRAWLTGNTDTWIMVFREESGQSRNDGRMVFSPAHNLDGVLPEKGRYRLTVVTTKNTTYTLNVKIQ